MIERCYKYINQGKRVDENNKKIQIYTFHSKIINQQYIVEVLRLEYDIYIIQFYLKTHRLSPDRFSLLMPVRKGIIENNSKHVFYLLNTIINIAKEIINENTIASIGFMGAPTIAEKDLEKNSANINPDNTTRNTKRHRVYSLYVKRYFSPEFFTHIEYENSSSYLLKNNKNKILNKELVDQYFNEIISEKID